MNNIFEAIPTNISDEIFETLVESQDVKVERIVSKGHSTPGSEWYDQDKNEWVIVLKGEAVLAFADGSSTTLKTGDYINIAAHQKHSVSWTNPDTETVWLAIHY
jgi:cupin 2 domain-containing protein